MLDFQGEREPLVKCRLEEADRCLSRLAGGKGRCFARTNRTNRSADKTVGLVGQGNRGSRISKVVV